MVIPILCANQVICEEVKAWFSYVLSTQSFFCLHICTVWWMFPGLNLSPHSYCKLHQLALKSNDLSEVVCKVRRLLSERNIDLFPEPRSPKVVNILQWIGAELQNIQFIYELNYKLIIKKDYYFPWWPVLSLQLFCFLTWNALKICTLQVSPKWLRLKNLSFFWSIKQAGGRNSFKLSEH